MEQSITLQLDVFEGPLDLLLYLIKKNDLEISRVSLSEITDQYLLYLDGLKELDIDNASEFLSMAAELAFIKSKMLLPAVEGDEEGEEGDVANDLIARLKEYERYKRAAKGLFERHWLNRDVFARGAFVEEENTGEEEKVVRDDTNENFEVDTFELVKVFHDILNRLPKEDVNHRVVSERVSVTARIYEVLDMIKNVDSILFTDLFTQDFQRVDVVVSFLALLEMAKLKMIRVFQTSSFEPIRIQRRIEMVDETAPNAETLTTLDDYK